MRRRKKPREKKEKKNIPGTGFGFSLAAVIVEKKVFRQVERIHRCFYYYNWDPIIKPNSVVAPDPSPRKKEAMSVEEDP